MIRTALRFVQKELEAYMIDRELDVPYITDQVVDLRSIVLPNGNLNLDENKHVTLMLVGVEEERREGKRPHFMPGANNEQYMLNPPVEIDLFLLFLAHSSSYGTALDDLSDIIAFFQANPVFDSRKYPSMNNGIEKPWRLIDRLSFKLVNMTFEQQNNLWAMLGIKYIPNVVYKMNMLTLFDTRSQHKVEPITEINLEEN
ncbi:DUF4255 domain-containing protein [Flavihumibacter solisilvae]|uniref:DUF4255 domain-containing protein n=1 Tax=Flavihumibacter solisilvae TaxID=1349421 RepID=UPI00068FEB1A|nr:DUF4255 domain-containing protein [Flavihumibacter solisilvae]